MLVNLQLLVNFGLIPCSRSRDIYFNMVMGSDCMVSNILSADPPFSQSETELRRTQLNEVGSPETQPTYKICCKGGRRDWCPRSTTQEIYPDGHPSRYQPRPTRLITSVNRREMVFPFGASWTRRRVRAVSFGPTKYEQCLHLSEWVTHLHIGVPARNLLLHFAYPRV